MKADLFIQGVAGLMDGTSETLCQVMLLEACCHPHICWMGTCTDPILLLLKYPLV